MYETPGMATVGLYTELGVVCERDENFFLQTPRPEPKVFYANERRYARNLDNLEENPND